MRALVLANGTPEDLKAWNDVLDQVQLIVAADGGARYARCLGIIPQFVIGDADSLDEETANWLAQSGSRLIRHPPAKDETDLELALLFAAQSGASEIVVVGAWGGRPDQAIANLQLLAHPALAGCDVRLLGSDFEAFLVQAGEEGVLRGAPGDTVSLIPFAGDVHGVRTVGLQWTLQEGDLRFGVGRGISNVLTAEEARVAVREGLLLVVHLLTQQARYGGDYGLCAP